jgi:hypothetical protein
MLVHEDIIYKKISQSPFAIFVWAQAQVNGLRTLLVLPWAKISRGEGKALHLRVLWEESPNSWIAGHHVGLGSAGSGPLNSQTDTQLAYKGWSLRALRIDRILI